jgi:hypothetical protein
MLANIFRVEPEYVDSPAELEMRQVLTDHESSEYHETATLHASP